MQMPGQDNLSGRLALGCGNLQDHRVSQRVDVHKFITACLPVTRSDGSVALKVDAPLSVENVDLLLLEVGVALDLVDNRFDAAASNKIGELGHDAVAHSNRLCQAGVDEGFHLSPNHVMRGRGNVPVRAFPVYAGTNPVHEVKVDVLELELAEGLAASAFNVIVAIVPQFGGDVKLLTLDTGGNALSDCLANLLLVGVDVSGVNVTIAVLKDGLLDHLLRVVGHEECAKTDHRDLGSVVQRVAGTLFSWNRLNHFLCAVRFSCLKILILTN